MINFSRYFFYKAGNVLVSKLEPRYGLIIVKVAEFVQKQLDIYIIAAFVLTLELAFV